jgi:quinolinate synthase
MKLPMTTEQTDTVLLTRYSSMQTGCTVEYTSQDLLGLVEEIRALKKQHNAVVLSHYYMPAELQITTEHGGIADFVGDSLGLSRAVMDVEADYIIFCGVKFMAETAFILNPGKKVLLPNHEAGCSLASSISGADVIVLKAQYPGVPVIAYVNTYAETKAECDICCTSRNALAIAESFASDTLIFLPDKFMGRNLQRVITEKTGKKMILWEGACEVHEQFTPGRIAGMQAMNPNAAVLVHWEVPDDAVVQALANSPGIVGSTSDIIRYVGESPMTEFILGSECDLGATLQGLYPEKSFVTPCIQCPHMKRITLENTRDALKSIGTSLEAKYVIDVPEDIRSRALLPIVRMMEFN